MNGVDIENHLNRRDSLENNNDGDNARDPNNDNHSKAGSKASRIYRMSQNAIMVTIDQIVAATTRVFMDAMRQCSQLVNNEANIQPVQRNTEPAAPKYSEIVELIPTYGKDEDDGVEKLIPRVDETQNAYRVPDIIRKLQASRRLRKRVLN